MANIFTQAGEEFVTDVLDATVAVPADYYIGWGTGAGTAVKGDTALVTEAAETRVAVVQTQPTVDTNRFTATMTSASTQSITEAGVFTAITAGTMLLSSDFAQIALINGDQIQFQFDLLHA